MIRKTTLAAVAAILLPLMFASGAHAQDTDENPVVIIVNGYEIRATEVSLAAESIANQLASLPAGARYPFVVQYLVERHLLAQEAVREKIEEDPEYKRLLSYYQAKVARDAYFLTKIKNQITEADARTEYDKQAAVVDNQVRVHLRHILVDDEETAKKVHAKLKGGANFISTADENVAEGEAKNGGDLGWLTRDEMFEEFVQAVNKTKNGEFSEPVKTSFGWHIIFVQDRQTTKAQPFDKIKEGLMALLARQRVQAIVNTLTSQAEIEVIDPDLQKLREQAKQQQQ